MSDKKKRFEDFIKVSFLKKTVTFDGISHKTNIVDLVEYFQ